MPPPDDLLARMRRLVHARHPPDPPPHFTQTRLFTSLMEVSHSRQPQTVTVSVDARRLADEIEVTQTHCRDLADEIVKLQTIRSKMPMSVAAGDRADGEEEDEGASTSEEEDEGALAAVSRGSSDSSF